MKKLLLSVISSIILSSSVMAQNVARECVLFEVFTGVNCPWCPGAASAIGRLLEEGKSVAAVAYHTSAFSVPELYTNETNSRANYYYISGYPTVKVDGKLSPSMSGQNGNEQQAQAAYNQGLNAYNQRMNVTSPYSINLSFDYLSGTDYKVTVNVNKVGECNANDARLFVVLTESHIQRTWQGMTEVNFVTRDMIPNQNGTQLTSDNETIELTVNMAGFLRNNCEIIAWVQNYSGDKEVYQAMKLPLSSLVFAEDLVIDKVEEVVLGPCSGKMAPRITFKNYGTENVTSAVFDIKAGDEIVSTYQWTGNVATNETADFLLPEFTFADTANIIIEASEVNGKNDGYPIDNIYEIENSEPFAIADGYIKLQLRTGEDPENMTIEIKNMDDDELTHTFTYDQPKKMYEEEIYLPKIGCYRMTIKNTAGNGFGGGFWGVRSSDNQVFMEGNQNKNTFRYEFAFELNCENVSVNEIEMSNDVNIYPNPAYDIINISANVLSKVEVYNAVGQMVYSENVVSDNVKIDTESWTNGLYYVKVETSEGNSTLQKVIVNK